MTGEGVAGQHRMTVCQVTLVVMKRNREKAEQRNKWERLRRALSGHEELPGDCVTTATVVRETGREVFSASSGQRKDDKETCWWKVEV